MPSISVGTGIKLAVAVAIVFTSFWVTLKLLEVFTPPTAPLERDSSIPESKSNLARSKVLEANRNEVSPISALPNLNGTGACSLKWAGIEGLSAQQVSGRAAVSGQSILHLVPVPTANTHRLLTQCTPSPTSGRTYRAVVWVRNVADGNIALEIGSSDPLNYGRAVFDASVSKAVSSSERIRQATIEKHADGWNGLAVDLHFSGTGAFFVNIGFVKRDGAGPVQSGGRMGFVLGGIELREGAP